MSMAERSTTWRWRADRRLRESPVAAGRSRSKKPRFYPGTRMWKGFAWLWRTGPRNCGGSKMNMAHERRADEDFRGTAPFVAHVRLQAKSGLVPRPLLNRRNLGRLWRTAGVRDVPELAPNAGKPPRQNPGGSIERKRRESTLDRVGPPPVFGLRGNHGQPHLLAERAGNESANRMRLPASRGHQFLEGDAVRAFHQIQNRGGLAAGAGAFRFRLAGRSIRACERNGVLSPNA